MTALGPEPSTGVKVVVHAQPRLFLETLTKALALQGHAVQLSAGDVEQVVTAVHQMDPDVYVVAADELPTWAETVRRVRELTPTVRVVVVVTHRTPALDRAYESGLVDAVVEVGCAFEQLHAAVMRAARGGRYQALAQDALPRGADDEPQLTEREREVLERLVRGDTTFAIARDLDISPHTVRTHVAGLMRKLGVHSRGRAVSVALARRVLESRSA